LKQQLQLLARLQEIDLHIDRHEGNLARLPLEVQEIARSLVVLRREMGEAREKLAATEKDLRRKEQDMAVEQEKIKRSERRLLAIKNQKEYNALSREIKLGKKLVGDLEEVILTAMTEMDNLNKFLERREGEYAASEESLNEKKAEAERTSKDAEEALSSLKRERVALVHDIDDHVMKRGTTIKRARGNAVAEMANGSCSGCNMAVPPQMTIQVLKQEECLECPNCHRILYVRPENVPELNRLQA